MILSASQLCALTGRVRPSAQRRTLDHLRIPYRLRPDGSIVVFEADRLLLSKSRLNASPLLAIALLPVKYFPAT